MSTAIECRDLRKVHAVLAQVADSFRFVPFEFHTGTSRM